MFKGTGSFRYDTLSTHALSKRHQLTEAADRGDLMLHCHLSSQGSTGWRRQCCQNRTALHPLHNPTWVNKQDGRTTSQLLCVQQGL
ncbi:hypothetical protein F7725_023788 [Dissostichus mawsoni]|uniref:Uncharacterized protein n=1 Tax=Dissostichus mawsoni TaxID=36200 RepID=A0A7J5XZB4_DISMA|nr:hypothetical protein F7725_023788 [Dissostichus mawsoni]